MQPYIIGTFTEFKFKKLDTLENFMLTLDPDAENLKKRVKNSPAKIISHYRKHWKSLVFENAVPKFDSTFSVTEQSSQPKTSKDRKHALWPFNPQLDRKLLIQEDDYSDSDENRMDPARFNEYETVWITGSLASPGKHTYFLVYKFDETRTFRTQISTVVGMR